MRTPTNVILDLIGKQLLVTRWQFLLDKFISRIIVRHSHPLNQILNSTNQSLEEMRQTRSPIVKTYLKNIDLFNQIKPNITCLDTSIIHIPSASFILI